MIPLRPQVHPQTMSQIFGNIEDLLNCNRRFLADLDRIRPNTYKDFNVGKTLSLYSHFFRVYKQYCNNYGDAMVVLGKLCSKDSQFEKFLNRAEQTSNHKLVDILITPIQRLVRLKLLLERIIKFTDESHEDFADLKCALVGISEVADYVNKGISQKEARLRVWEVQRMLVRVVVVFSHITFSKLEHTYTGTHARKSRRSTSTLRHGGIPHESMQKSKQGTILFPVQ